MKKILLFLVCVFVLSSCNNDEKTAEKTIDLYMATHYPEINVYKNVVVVSSYLEGETFKVVNCVTLDYSGKTSERFFKVSKDLKKVKEELTNNEVNLIMDSIISAQAKSGK